MSQASFSTSPPHSSSTSPTPASFQPAPSYAFPPPPASSDADKSPSSLYTSSSSSSSIPIPFTPVRQRSSHVSDGGSSITINPLTSPTSGHTHPSPSSSHYPPASLVRRWLSCRFRLRPFLLLLLAVVTAMLLLTAAVTSVGFSSLPSITVASQTSSVPSPLPHSGDRNILHTPATSGQCVNSMQGKELLVDSNGVVCERQDIDADSRCCAEGFDRLSCRSCRHDLHCCHSYEYCISCCLGRQTDEAAIDSLHAFGQCAAVCRTSSASIKHGNVYKHAYHHCYDKLGPVALNLSAYSPPPPFSPPTATTDRTDATATAASTPSALSVVAGELGYSCEATCANRSLSCHDSLLSLANNCDALQSHFACRECELSDGGDQPAWVSDTAGKDYPESRCLVQRQGVNGGLTCEGRHEKTRRLCVCLSEEAANEEGAVEVEHFDGDDDT